MSRTPGVVQLLSAATATGAGGAFRPRYPATFQAAGVTSAGAGAVSVAIQVSNDGVNWLTLGTITLTLSTTSASDGFAADVSWAFVRANVLSISGTGAAVSVNMGC